MFDFFKKKPGNQLQAIKEDYSIGKLEQNGKVYLVRFNKWLHNIAPDPKYPFQVGIATSLKANNNGMPDKEENSQLLKIEEMLIDSFQKDKTAIYAGTITGGGMKEFVFYTGKPRTIEQIYNQLKQEIKHHDIQLNIQEDKDWKVFKMYCPK